MIVMNTHLHRRFFRVILPLLACTVIFAGHNAQAQDKAGITNVPMDNPHGRAAFELLRIADPATGQIPHGILEKEHEFSKTIPTRDDMLLQKGVAAAGALTQTWTFRGPDNVGGRSRALALDIANENNVLAGGVSGGMWRSIDGGTSWVRVTPFDRTQSVSCVAQDTRPGKTNVWYYGTGEYIGNSASGNFSANYRGDGIFKSIDNGATWTQLASTKEGLPQDFGRFKYIWRMATDPVRSDSDVVYAAAMGGIYRSNDGGDSWNLVLGGGSRWSSTTDLAITSTGVLYATLNSYAVIPSTGAGSGNSTYRGMWRSEDGLNWVKITPTGYPSAYRRIVLGIAPSDEKVVYFLAETPGAGYQTYDPLGEEEYHTLYKYTYVSGDGSGAGGTWENRSSSLPFFLLLGPFSSQGSYNLVIKVKPDNPDHVFIGGTNVYRSTNGYKTANTNAWIGGYNRDYDPYGANLLAWMDLSYPYHHPDIHDLIFSPTNPNVMYSASDGGIHKTNDCRQSSVIWIPLNNGFVTSQFYAIAIDKNKTGDELVMGGMQDNNTFGSQGPGKPWQWLGGGDGGFCAVAPGKTNTYFISSQFGSLYRTETDNSLYVNELFRANVSGVNRYSFPFIAPWEFDPNQPNTIYMASNSIIYRNTYMYDKYVSDLWTPLDNTNPGNSYISAIAVSTQPAGKLFIGSSNGKITRLDDAPNSLDAPVTISKSPLPSGYVSCIAPDPENADVILAVFSTYGIPSLFYTEDGGQNWTDVSGNLEEFPDGKGAGPSCRWADMVRVDGKRMWFVGTSTGLYSTTALNGTSTVWVREGANIIGNAIVTMIRTRQSDQFVAIGTHGNGVFTTHAVPVSTGTVPDVPGTFFLEQNYPNPAVEGTTIRFSVPNTEQFTISLHDAAGRDVRAISSGSRMPGVHEQYIETSGLAAGSYFIRLASKEYTQTRMMTVSR